MNAWTSLPLNPSQTCPKCGSTRIVGFSLLQTDDQPVAIEACVACSVYWEALPEGEPRFPEEPDMAFAEPCDNCAFRAGSPESRDKSAWRELLEKLKRGGEFYCHKGVPIDPDSEHGFDYPRLPDGSFDRQANRLCKGFLNAWRKWEVVNEK